LALVRRAEALGYDAAFIDGDVSMLPKHPARTPLHGFTATTAMLHQTQRIAVGSIRLVHHWNAAVLAHALASLDALVPGRILPLISIGGRPADARFGLPLLTVPERIAWLDESLDAITRLWRGETVSSAGRYVTLDQARVRPIPPRERLQLAIAAKGERMLELVARYAARWDLNLPPVARRVRDAEQKLQLACEAHHRDPANIRRQMWLYTRIAGRSTMPAIRSAFRELNPWFAYLQDFELDEAIVSGTVEECRARIETVQQELILDLAILDLSGLDAPEALRHIELLAPSVDAGRGSI